MGAVTEAGPSRGAVRAGAPWPVRVHVRSVRRPVGLRLGVALVGKRPDRHALPTGGVSDGAVLESIDGKFTAPAAGEIPGGTRSNRPRCAVRTGLADGLRPPTGTSSLCSAPPTGLG